MIRLSALLATAVALVPVPARAAQPPIEEIIVTAARLPLPAADLGARTLAGADLERAGGATLGQALAGVPGLFADAPGGPGGFAALYLRGTDPNHTLVLVDGMKLNDPTNSRGGAFDPSGLLVFGLERVEILGGAASAVHGSDAIGGVLNIVTRGGTDTPEAEVEVAAGTDDVYRLAAALRGPLGPVRAALSAVHADSGTPRSGNRFDAEQGLARLDAGIGRADLSLSARWKRFRAEAFPEDAGGTEYAVIRETERRDGEARGAALRIALPLGDRLALSLDGAVLDRREDVASPGVAPGPRDPFGLPASDIRTDFARQQGAASLVLTGGDGLTALVGGSLEREDGESAGALFFGPLTLPAGFALDRTTGALFTQVAWLPPDGVGGHVGLRLDRPEGAKDEVSPSVGLRWRSGGTLLRGGLAEGFKLPGFYALGNPLVGNRGLTAERSRTIDLSLTQAWVDGRVSVTGTLFHTRIRDIIDFDPGPPARLVNRDTLTARGVELSAAASLTPALRLEGFISHTDSALSDGAPMRDRPRWQAGGAVSLTAGRWDVRAALRYRGKILDTAIPTGDVTLSDAAIADLGLRWSPSDQTWLELAASNLFDAADRERVGTPGPGRRFLLRSRVRF